jgi:Fe-S cluster assembly protein SufD
LAELQTSVREPAWLAQRRERAAELAATLDLPQFKGTPGWEFTSLAKFSLDAFAAAAPGDGDASAVERVQTLLEAPEGALTLGQVDGRVIETPDAVDTQRTSSAGTGDRAKEEVA